MLDRVSLEVEPGHRVGLLGNEALLDAIEHFALPTIAVLNGCVYGGATDLALCCDGRLGVTGTRMFMPAARFGLHHYPGGLRRYVSALGAAQAKSFSPATRCGEEMLRVGFLTELVSLRAACANPFPHARCDCRLRARRGAVDEAAAQRHRCRRRRADAARATHTRPR